MNSDPHCGTWKGTALLSGTSCSRRITGKVGGGFQPEAFVLLVDLPSFPRSSFSCQHDLGWRKMYPSWHFPQLRNNSLMRFLEALSDGSGTPPRGRWIQGGSWTLERVWGEWGLLADCISLWIARDMHSIWKIHQHPNPFLSSDPSIPWGSWEINMLQMGMGLASSWDKRKQDIVFSYRRVGQDLHHYQHMEEREERLNPYELTGCYKNGAHSLSSIWGAAWFLKSGIFLS